MSRPGGKTFAAAAASGLLFALAFPPREWVLLLPVALVPWLLALRAETSRTRALFSGFVFGLAYWCASIPWISYVVVHYGGQTPALGVVCVALIATILAEWPALVAWGTVAAAPARSGIRLALFPLIWMASEHARSFVYGGFPWNLTAGALYRHPVWIQSASVWGAFGVGALVMGISSVLAHAIATRRLRPALAAAAAALAVGAWGAASLASRAPGSSARSDRRISVALLQPNVTEETRRSGSAAAAYAAVLEQARRAANAGPDLIVIPESAFPVYWDESPTLRRDLSAIAERSAIVFNDIEQGPGGRYFNVARLLEKGGLVGRPYRKVHLVPFGEYVPLPRLFFFVRQVSSEIGEFSASEAPTVLAGEPERIGMGVCYEILYPGLAREQVARLGANVLVTISNDSWYGRAGAQQQHFAGAVLRSVENGRDLLRAAITGISGIVDAKGRILAELPPDRAGILFSTATLRERKTAWTAWGFWLPRLADLCAAGVLVLGVSRWWRGRRHGRSAAKTARNELLR